MNNAAIFAALVAGDLSSPALAQWHELSTERRQVLRQEIATDQAQQLRQAESALPMNYATQRQATIVEKLQSRYGVQWLIQEPGISIAQAIRQQARGESAPS